MITAYCLAFEIVRLSALSREFTLAITHMENIIDYFIVSFVFLLLLFFWGKYGNILCGFLYDWIQVRRLRI